MSQAHSTISIPDEPIEVVGQLRGSVDRARVGIIEFADFQCPFCRAFAMSIEPEIVRDYVETGRVVWSYRHLPLTSIHPHARPAADLSECIGSQLGFWRVHGVLFTKWQGGPLTADELSRLLDVDASSVQSCLGRPHPSVDRDLQAARDLGVTGTPTFLVGPMQDGRLAVEDVLVGSSTLEQFRKAIDSSLLRVSASLPSR